MRADRLLIDKTTPVLVTGAAGFIGARVVRTLLEKGFCNVRCLVRPTSSLKRLKGILDEWDANGKAEIITGNLLSPADCEWAVRGAAVIYHLAAGTGTKSFADAYMNSVVTTRNLIEAALREQALKRFVNLSSFSVYTNQNPPRRGVLDESCPVETNAGERAEAYCYAKVKQDELVEEYGRMEKLPYVHLRPGVVYGPGKGRIPGRVGVSTFGIFLHFGGPSQIPFTYIDNCAEAIVLAGLQPGIDGEVMNIVDDDLPTSREFLRMYQRRVKRFKSILRAARGQLAVLLWVGAIQSVFRAATAAGVHPQRVVGLLEGHALSER